MNYNKAQERVFKALVNGNRVIRFDIDEQNTCISPDGFQGWVFQNRAIVLDVEKIPVANHLNLKGLVLPENELKQTLDFKLVNERSKTMLRKFEGQDKTVWVNSSYLDLFQNPKFWQEKDKPLGHIVVTEKIRKEDVPVGVVLPVRILGGTEVTM